MVDPGPSCKRCRVGGEEDSPREYVNGAANPHESISSGEDVWEANGGEHGARRNPD